MHRLRSQLVAGVPLVDGSPLVDKSGDGQPHPEGLAATDIRRKDRRSTNQRTATRHRLSEEPVTVIYDDGEWQATLLNLSDGGAMIECRMEPEINSQLWLQFDDCEPLETCVRWVASGRIGVEFSDETEVISEILEGSTGADDRRFSPERRRDVFRHGLYWTGELCIDTDGVDIRLRNVSATGAMVRAAEDKDWVEVGAEVELDLGVAGCIVGHVRWRRGVEVGIKFVREFDVRRLSRDEGYVAQENAWVRPEYLKTKNTGDSAIDGIPG